MGGVDVRVLDPFLHVELGQCPNGAVLRFILRSMPTLGIKLQTFGDDRVMVAVLEHPDFAGPGYVEIDSFTSSAAYLGECVIEPVIDRESAPGYDGFRSESGILFLSARGQHLQLNKLGSNSGYDIRSFNLNTFGVDNYPSEAVPCPHWNLWADEGEIGRLGASPIFSFEWRDAGQTGGQEQI